MASEEAPRLPVETPERARVLEARELTKQFRVHEQRGGRVLPGRSVLHAVEEVSLSLEAGRVVAIVGESGCGKSTLGRLLALLETPTGGEVLLRGRRVRARSSRGLRPYRRSVQIVFQDPFASLNPIHTVGYHIARPLRIHRLSRGRADTRRRVLELLERVRLIPGERFIDKYPHELSGGQRQRVAFARALAVDPDVLLADEPVSMLDVSIRLSMLNLLAELCHEQNLALLYITHDIASARYFADTVLVMYAGRLVEGGPAEDVTQSPAHPYTQLLLAAAPNPDIARSARAPVPPGEPPSLISPPPGCRFHPRCPLAQPVCKTDVPPPMAVGADRWAACWVAAGVTTSGGAGAQDE